MQTEETFVTIQFDAESRSYTFVHVRLREISTRRNSVADFNNKQFVREKERSKNGSSPPPVEEEGPRASRPTCKNVFRKMNTRIIERYRSRF